MVLFFVPFAGIAGGIVAAAIAALFWCCHVLFGTAALGYVQFEALVVAGAVIGAAAWLAFSALMCAGWGRPY